MYRQMLYAPLGNLSHQEVSNTADGTIIYVLGLVLTVQHQVDMRYLTSHPVACKELTHVRWGHLLTSSKTLEIQSLEYQNMLDFIFVIIE